MTNPTSANAPTQVMGTSHAPLQTVLVEYPWIPGLPVPIPVRAHPPGDGVGRGVLLGMAYCHGGGCIGGPLGDSSKTIRNLAADTPATAISVDCSRLPKRLLLAATEDAYAALPWLIVNTERMNIDPGRIAVAGDDAGVSAQFTRFAVSHADSPHPRLLAEVVEFPRQRLAC